MMRNLIGEKAWKEGVEVCIWIEFTGTHLLAYRLSSINSPSKQWKEMIFWVRLRKYRRNITVMRHQNSHTEWPLTSSNWLFIYSKRDIQSITERFPSSENKKRRKKDGIETNEIRSRFDFSFISILDSLFKDSSVVRLRIILHSQGFRHSWTKWRKYLFTETIGEFPFTSSNLMELHTRQFLCHPDVRNTE